MPRPSSYVSTPTFDFAEGNQILRQIVRDRTVLYEQAPTKKAKSAVVMEIVEQIRTERAHGGFVRKDYEMGRWIEIGELKAREKVGHAIRIEIKKRKSGGFSSKAKEAKQSTTHPPTHELSWNMNSTSAVARPIDPQQQQQQQTFLNPMAATTSLEGSGSRGTVPGSNQQQILDSSLATASFLLNSYQQNHQGLVQKEQKQNMHSQNPHFAFRKDMDPQPKSHQDISAIQNTMFRSEVKNDSTWIQHDRSEMFSLAESNKESHLVQRRIQPKLTDPSNSQLKGGLEDCESKEIMEEKTLPQVSTGLPPECPQFPHSEDGLMPRRLPLPDHRTVLESVTQHQESSETASKDYQAGS